MILELNFNAIYTDRIPQTPHLLNHTYYIVWRKVLRQRAARLSRQRRTIGSFSATAGLLIKIYLSQKDWVQAFHTHPMMPLISVLGKAKFYANVLQLYVNLLHAGWPNQQSLSKSCHLVELYRTARHFKPALRHPDSLCCRVSALCLLSSMPPTIPSLPARLSTEPFCRVPSRICIN